MNYTIYKDDNTIKVKDSNDVIVHTGTIIQEVVNWALNNSGDNSTITINGDYEISTLDGTYISIPSKRNLVINGIIKQAANSSSRVPIIGNRNRLVGGTGNSDISLTVNGTIDGNYQNQPGSYTDNGVTFTTQLEYRYFAVSFYRVTNLSIPKIRVINPTAWSLDIHQCSNTTIGSLDTYSPMGGYRDGLHFVDSNNAIVDSITGTSGDDLLAITSDYFDVSNIHVRYMNGSTTWANGIRISHTKTSIDRGGTISNVIIDNAILNNTYHHGITFAFAGTNTVTEDISINFKITNPGSANNLSIYGIQFGQGGGTFNRLNLKGCIYNPNRDGVTWGPNIIVNNSIFEIGFKDIPKGYKNYNILGTNNNNKFIEKNCTQLDIDRLV